MKLLNCLFIVVAMSAGILGCSSKDPHVVATVLDKKILVEDFRQRYKQYLENTNARDNIVLRQTVLNNMINETIIFQDLHDMGLDRDSAAEHRMNIIRNQALLDEYSKRITTDTMTISEQEYQDEFRNYNSKVRARYIYGATEEDAWILKHRVERGESFEMLARNVFQDPGLANNGGDLGFFGWNEMEQGMEEFAFREPVGSVSDPIKISAGYAIVKIEKRVLQPLLSEYDFAKSKTKLERLIRERKTVQYLKDVSSRIATSMNPTFNKEAVASLLEHWKYVAGFTDGERQLNETPFPRIDFTNLFATVKGEHWTVRDFLLKLEATTPAQRRRVKTSNDIQEIALGLAVREELIRRAKEMNLESNHRVVSQVKIATERYLLTRWSDFVEDTLLKNDIDEQELKEHYKKFSGHYSIPPEVNVAEILVRSKTEALSLRKQIDSGQKFADMARKHSIRLWAAANGGTLGFGSRTTYGILADTFFNAPIGTTIGPVKVDPYFGIYRVLEKREAKMKPFSAVRDEVLKTVRATKKLEGLRIATGNLRNHVAVDVDMEILSNVMVN